jgi:hypothetical protein
MNWQHDRRAAVYCTVTVILPSGLSLAASGDCPVAEGALKIALNANAVVVPSLPVGPEPLREIGKLYLKCNNVIT